MSRVFSHQQQVLSLCSLRWTRSSTVDGSKKHSGGWHTTNKCTFVYHLYSLKFKILSLLSFITYLLCSLQLKQSQNIPHISRWLSSVYIYSEQLKFLPYLPYPYPLPAASGTVPSVAALFAFIDWISIWGQAFSDSDLGPWWIEASVNHTRPRCAYTRKLAFGAITLGEFKTSDEQKHKGSFMEPHWISSIPMYRDRGWSYDSEHMTWH